jgi:hypothetical protein
MPKDERFGSEASRLRDLVRKNLPAFFHRRVRLRISSFPATAFPFASAGHAD